MCSSCVKDIYVTNIQANQINKCKGCRQFVANDKKRITVIKNLSNEIAANAFICLECDFVTSQSYDLLVHKESDHMQPCDQCQYIATTSKLLEYHKGKKHIRCDQCDYVATHLGNLNTHIEIKHKMIRYLCHKCDFSGLTKGHLKNHIESKHEGIRSL